MEAVAALKFNAIHKAGDAVDSVSSGTSTKTVKKTVPGANNGDGIIFTALLHCFLKAVKI